MLPRPPGPKFEHFAGQICLSRCDACGSAGGAGAAVDYPTALVVATLVDCARDGCLMNARLHEAIAERGPVRMPRADTWSWTFAYAPWACHGAVEIRLDELVSCGAGGDTVWRRAAGGPY